MEAGVLESPNRINPDGPLLLDFDLIDSATRQKQDKGRGGWRAYLAKSRPVRS